MLRFTNRRQAPQNPCLPHWLSHSRKAYSEAVYRQTTDEFLRCIESAFRHFGGVPRRLVLDNLKAAVTKADWFDPELNPKVRSFGEHYGFVFWPTRPRTPRHKGKVEKSVDYVQSNALKARRFHSLEEQNTFLLNWELTVADTRTHGTTRRQVGKHFAEVDAGHWYRCHWAFSRRSTRAAALCTAMAMLRSSGPTMRCRRNTGTGTSGLGQPPRVDLQRSDGEDRRASQDEPGVSVRHGNSLTRGRSAASRKAQPGCCAG